ncbi:transposable element Tcb1 transposase [Trichonephila clavipes]|nr:transposable element Tcb1 transposase [Trichonephila clavipes]
MTGQRYVHDILQPHVFLLMQWLPEAIFQQYNARPHTARVLQDCLRIVTTLPWPVRSPDLSQIKHIWDHWGRRVGHPTSLNELEARLQQIWNEMFQDIIRSFYASMPERIASCIRARGGSTGTSPVTSLYVVCHQPPLELRRRQLSANYFIRATSVPSHPLKTFSLATGLTRLYDARSFNLKPFSERAKAILNDAHLSNTNIQENNILAFPPWDIQIFNYSNPFSGYDKAGPADVIYHQLSFLSIAVSILSTYQSTRTDRRLQDMLGVVLFLIIPF